MGTVPISEIARLSITPAEEPMLEPPLPVSRPENALTHADSDRESYSPSHSRDSSNSSCESDETDEPGATVSQPELEPQPTEAAPDHQIDLLI